MRFKVNKSELVKESTKLYDMTRYKVTQKHVSNGIIIFCKQKFKLFFLKLTKTKTKNEKYRKEVINIDELVHIIHTTLTKKMSEVDKRLRMFI